MSRKLARQVRLKHGTEVASAFQPEGYRAGEWPVIRDNGNADLVWLYENEHHARFVVCAASFEAALEAVYDELEPVPLDEIHEAYGYDTAEEFEAARKEAEDSGEDFCPELAECHHYQANATGSGIVFPGYSESLHEYTRDDAARVRLTIGAVE